MKIILFFEIKEFKSRVICYFFFILVTLENSRSLSIMENKKKARRIRERRNSSDIKFILTFLTFLLNSFLLVFLFAHYLLHFDYFPCLPFELYTFLLIPSFVFPSHSSPAKSIPSLVLSDRSLAVLSLRIP